MKTTPPTVGIGAGLLLAAGCMAVLVQMHSEKLKAPAWVVFFALGLLGFAGICIIGQALRLNGLVRWLVCVLLGAMVAIPGWVAFGSGPRQCSVVSFGTHSAASAVVCRSAFGAAAIVLAIMFAVAVRNALRSRHAGRHLD
jgi:hypothetical protein